MGRPWFVRSEAAHPAPHPPQRICFLFNAQIHQLFHRDRQRVEELVDLRIE